MLAPSARVAYRAYRRTGRTSRLGYTSMRKLFGADCEAFEGLADRAALDNPSIPINEARGLLEPFADEALAQLQRDGFYVLPTRLDRSYVDDLVETARASTCQLIDPVPGAPSASRFDSSNPQAVRYEVPESDILRARAAQALVADRSLLALSQRYLAAMPVQDLVAMWWSTAIGTAPSSPAAQLFHFDLDRLRFLKFFVYLTDVDEESGPHAYVRGSHKQLPRQLREDRRYTDEEVEASFPGQTVSIAGPTGTMFLADTRGLHKGAPLQKGHRLVFQLEYASSLFGAPYDRVTVPAPSEDFRAAVRDYPLTFERFAGDD